MTIKQIQKDQCAAQRIIKHDNVKESDEGVRKDLYEERTSVQRHEE